MLKHDSKPSFVRLTRGNGRATTFPFGSGYFNTTPGPGWMPCLPIRCSSIVTQLSRCNRRTFHSQQHNDCAIIIYDLCIQSQPFYTLATTFTIVIRLYT